MRNQNRSAFSVLGVDFNSSDATIKTQYQLRKEQLAAEKQSIEAQYKSRINEVKQEEQEIKYAYESISSVEAREKYRGFTFKLVFTGVDVNAEMYILSYLSYSELFRLCMVCKGLNYFINNNFINILRLQNNSADSLNLSNSSDINFALNCMRIFVEGQRLLSAPMGILGYEPALIKAYWLANKNNIFTEIGYDRQVSNNQPGAINKLDNLMALIESSKNNPELQSKRQNYIKWCPINRILPPSLSDIDLIEFQKELDSARLDAQLYKNLRKTFVPSVNRIRARCGEAIKCLFAILSIMAVGVIPTSIIMVSRDPEVKESGTVVLLVLSLINICCGLVAAKKLFTGVKFKENCDEADQGVVRDLIERLQRERSKLLDQQNDSQADVNHMHIEVIDEEDEKEVGDSDLTTPLLRGK